MRLLATVVRAIGLAMMALLLVAAMPAARAAEPCPWSTLPRAIEALLPVCDADGCRAAWLYEPEPGKARACWVACAECGIPSSLTLLAPSATCEGAICEKAKQDAAWLLHFWSQAHPWVVAPNAASDTRPTYAWVNGVRSPTPAAERIGVGAYCDPRVGRLESGGAYYGVAGRADRVALCRRVQ